MRYILCLIFFLLLPTVSFGDSITLEWSPNSETDLAGYRVFMREASQGYDYLSPAWEGTETTCRIESIIATKKYYFVVRAFDTEEYESENSNEVAYFMGTIPDGLPPGKPKTVTITIIVTVP